MPEKTGMYEHNIGGGWAAWEEARAHFTRADGNYTDDFGGVFIDENGIFNISVVGNRRPVISAYLIYRQVSNPYNFLEDILDEVSKTGEEYTVWEAGICERCNGVYICLENKRKIHPLIRHLKTKKLFMRNSLNIFVGESDMIWALGSSRKSR